MQKHCGHQACSRPSQAPIATPVPQLGSCKFFLQGSCTRGDACTFWHPLKSVHDVGRGDATAGLDNMNLKSLKVIEVSVGGLSDRPSLASISNANTLIQTSHETSHSVDGAMSSLLVRRRLLVSDYLQLRPVDDGSPSGAPLGRRQTGCRSGAPNDANFGGRRREWRTDYRTHQVQQQDRLRSRR